MTDYLTVNRFPIPIMESSPIIQPQGRYMRGVDGFGGSSFTNFKRAWRLRTALMDAAELEAAQGLLLGEGHAWDFEDAALWQTSSRGLPLAGFVNVARGTSIKKYGSAAAAFTTSGQLTWLTGLQERWTVAMWFSPAVESFDHRVFDSDGNFYLDGVLGADPGGVSIAVDSDSGDLTIDDDGADIHIDDLIAVPYLMSPSLIASVAADNSPFSPLPEIEISGDIATAGGLKTGIIPAAIVRPETFSRSTVHLAGALGGALSFDLVEG